ncbi:orotidine-5'-phosphate decarboxylase [Thermoactinomyces sp. DSM 45892]|uniref:orotidine-5'-phosphate decarboxylase n=1 Tax=Thermoactinomyces sp. DSM 45892 TaxID=1882753 RepID=UPI00089766CD|nr:orotidine-5'-phosphate decarboxylase [Thermoactinomyces sp. DSM 45892]SDY59027.1 orotidine-5'-phosphate decarboxylase [Thermoactinomyces sp. DSM 45892]
MDQARRQLMIALDLPSGEDAEKFLTHWQGEEKPWIKVGYQLFYATGPRWIYERKQEGYSIFLDLKLHDIPNTVAKAVESISKLDVDFLTLHAMGGSEMIKHARESAEKCASSSECRTRLLAVTQLTSTHEEMLHDEIGINGSMEQAVLRSAKLAHQAGADGVICSGQEARAIKDATEPFFLAVTPGIRPVGASVNDQKRVVTPTAAIQAGADHLVVGRAITHALDPLKAYHQILQEIIDARGNHR